MQILEKIKLLPTSPGVYQFLDENGVIIYVGKAVNLHRRVNSYFLNLQSHTTKVRALVRHIKDMRYTVVGDERDALLLENNLIKQYQPHYNILLKDSKSYPWIVITSEPFPRIFSTRKVVKGLGEYFGPYSNVGIQKTILSLLRELFPIRTCRHNLSDEEIAKGKFSVCLEYHIGKCKGCCTGMETQDEYDRYIQECRKILKGNLTSAKEYLIQQMQNAAEELRFEDAEHCRKQLILLEDYSNHSIIVSQTLTNVDVINIHIDGDNVFCNHMHVDEGAITGSYTFEMRKALDESADELLTFAICNIEKLSKKVIIPFMPTGILPEGITYNVPQRGDMTKLLELSLHNCKQQMVEKMKYLKKTDPEKHSNELMRMMMEELKLPKEPRHIECFDNSNLQGTSPVASCVVFRDGFPSKKEYRHFNIKTVIGANDFASMHEIVLRRYKRLLEENQELPDLIVIDGGKGQLSFAYNTLKELGLEDKIPIVGLAKRMEEVFRPGISDPMFLDKRGETLRVLMYIRDESHRFGITFHRKKRSEKFLKSELDGISGIGKASIAKIIAKYHTIKKIQNAKEEDLIELIGKDKTIKLKEFLNQSTNC